MFKGKIHPQAPITPTYLSRFHSKEILLIESFFSFETVLFLTLPQQDTKELVLLKDTLLLYGEHVQTSRPYFYTVF